MTLEVEYRGPTIVGFTGTRKGMTIKQRTNIAKWVIDNQPVAAHHGMCVGADAQFHELIRRYSPSTYIHGHPPEDTRWLAQGLDCNETDKPKPFLERDRDIVIAGSSLLIAAPYQPYPVLRGSGTWYTYRYAEKRGSPTWLVLP